ncbi:MAG: hypothetical protein IIA90_08660 [Chloroflexi bacterium]|nr:hypothetical protein [Chloroflexota bacterium]
MIADLRDERFGQNTLFSRRRSRRRPQPQGQYRLPDWVWGLAIGALVVIVGGGFFLIIGVRDSGGRPCDNELSRLPGVADATAEAFREEDLVLGQVIAYINQADFDNALASFYGEVHAFTHDIDADVRAADEEKAKLVCEAVIDLEELLESNSPGAMAAAAANLREELRDAAEVLGFPRPGG